jgi:hypothetical protein
LADEFLAEGAAADERRVSARQRKPVVIRSTARLVLVPSCPARI